MRFVIILKVLIEELSLQKKLRNLHTHTHVEHLPGRHHNDDDDVLRREEMNSFVIYEAREEEGIRRGGEIKVRTVLLLQTWFHLQVLARRWGRAAYLLSVYYESIKFYSHRCHLSVDAHNGRPFQIRRRRRRGVVVKYVLHNLLLSCFVDETNME